MTNVAGAATASVMSVTHTALTGAGTALADKARHITVGYPTYTLHDDSLADIRNQLTAENRNQIRIYFVLPYHSCLLKNATNLASQRSRDIKKYSKSPKNSRNSP